MKNILKAEFRKLTKGKIIYVLLAFVIIFPLITAGMFKIITTMSEDNEMIVELLGPSSIIQAFNPLNNIGLLLLILMIVTTLSDFSQKTIRNKLVGGYSKTEVYLTSLIKVLTISIITMTLYSLLTYISIGVLISFSSIPFKSFILTYTIGIVSTTTLYSLVNFLSFKFQTLGKTLGILLASLFIGLIVYQILAMSVSESVSTYLTVFVPILNLMSIEVLETKYLLMSLASNLVYIGLINYIGILINKKQDYI